MTKWAGKHNSSNHTNQNSPNRDSNRIRKENPSRRSRDPGDPDGQRLLTCSEVGYAGSSRHQNLAPPIIWHSQCVTTTTDGSESLLARSRIAQGARHCGWGAFSATNAHCVSDVLCQIRAKT